MHGTFELYSYVKTVRGEFLPKKYFLFLRLAKNYTVFFLIKNKDLIFPTVLESYGKSFMQKNWRKIDSKPSWE
jgi:hypothetical protein